MPVPLRGSTKYGIFLSRIRIPTPIMNTSGYIAMRSYQHKTHGGKPNTLLKYKLPNIATNAIVHAMYKICSFKNLIMQTIKI